MPRIEPFRAMLYDPDKVKSPSEVVAPPYDIIPEGLQSALYGRSPYNIVRLTLGKIGKADNAGENRYTRAEKFFKSWLKKHILLQDGERRVYIYSQTYKKPNDIKLIERIGFIALMELNSDKGKKVLPHENTLLAPKLDRLSLMRSVSANLEPIFVLYEDNGHDVINILENFCRKNKPFVDIEFDEVIHRVWRLKDTAVIRQIQSLMAPKDIFIADGHHRYEVALTYAAEMANSKDAKELKKNSKYIMAYFVELNKEMLTILPTHRVVRDIGILKIDDIKNRLSKFFDMKKISSLDSLIRKLNAIETLPAFGMYLGKGHYELLKLKDLKVVYRLLENHSRDWKRLDVTILHLFILEYVLGIRDDDDNVEFLKDAGEAARFVNRGKFRMAFFLNPTKVSQVKRIAQLGERMPRKATYFYPKPLSGLVINRFD